jgi:GTP1/Obg family GTP-binding protein
MQNMFDRRHNLQPITNNLNTTTNHLHAKQVDALRKAIQEVGKAYANRAAKAANKREATLAADEGAEMMQKIFTKGARSIDDLKRVSKQLRGLPYVEPQLPTLALVGAPNVGKSSLVQVRGGWGRFGWVGLR